MLACNGCAISLPPTGLCTFCCQALHGSGACAPEPHGDTLALSLPRDVHLPPARNPPLLQRCGLLHPAQQQSLAKAKRTNRCLQQRACSCGRSVCCPGQCGIQLKQRVLLQRPQEVAAQVRVFKQRQHQVGHLIGTAHKGIGAQGWVGRLVACGQAGVTRRQCQHHMSATTSTRRAKE